MKRKQGSTIFLRLVVYLIGIFVLTLCILGLTQIAKGASQEYVHLLYPILIIMYMTTIPFFIALSQTLKLLGYIDKNKAFSKLSVKALKNIKNCAVIISILYVICMPFLYLLAEKDDAPGIILIGMLFVFAPIVIATFSAVLQKLLQDAIDIKSDNDLTI